MEVLNAFDTRMIASRDNCRAYVAELVEVGLFLLCFLISSGSC